MKKSIMALIVCVAVMGCAQAYENNFLNNVKKDFSNATQSIQNDMKNVTTQSKRGADSPMSLQDEIDSVKARKQVELDVVNKKISDKEAQMRKVIFDTNLTFSQKKSKTSVLQKEIGTLKTQKTNIEEKYRKEIQAFRYN